MKKILLFCFFNSFFNTWAQYNLPGLEKEWDDWFKVHIVIKEWSAAQCCRLNIQAKLVLYPFGGGDVIFPISFFPDFQHLVLIGLEPTGKDFSLSEAVKENLRHLLKRGFFVTRDMEKFYKNGMLSIILVQLKQLGATNIRWQVLHKHLEINFVLNEMERKVTYIQMNLSDENYENWSVLFEKYKEYVLYIKSASFVPQQIGFGKIRDKLMAGANVILQDDTGIAYEDLKKNGFIIELFGKYSIPYNAFGFSVAGLESFFQEALKAAYAETSTEELPFSIGYRSGLVPSNYLIAMKVVCIA